MILVDTLKINIKTEMNDVKENKKKRVRIWLMGNAGKVIGK